MVFFSCNACGDSLKKNQVEKHYATKCRQGKSLSCIDCSKEFWGEDYNQHTKCISEEEKYSGKNYVPKAGANKGEQKQSQWVEQVQAAIDGAKSDKNIHQLLQKIKDCPNIPRKQAKFKNFVKNSLRVHQERLIDQAWDLIMKHAGQANAVNKPPPEKPVNGAHEGQSKAEKKKEQKEQTKKERKEERKRKRQTEVNGDAKEEEEEEGQLDKPKKKKKRKREEEEGEEETNGETEAKRPAMDACQEKLNCVEEDGEVNEDDSKSTEKFDWEEVITAVLEKKGELPIKKLRKKVLAEYTSRKGEPRSEEKILAKFSKKVNKNPKFKVHKERVKLKK